MQVVIYGLAASDEDEVMYVGKTINREQRLLSHLMDATNGCESPKSQWIRELIENGRMPVMRTLEECDEEVWKEREKFWITHYRTVNQKLTNAHDSKTRKRKEEKPDYLRVKHKITVGLTDSEMQLAERLLKGTYIERLSGLFRRFICEAEENPEKFDFLTERQRWLEPEPDDSERMYVVE